MGVCVKEYRGKALTKGIPLFPIFFGRDLRVWVHMLKIEVCCSVCTKTRQKQLGLVSRILSYKKLFLQPPLDSKRM